MKLLTSHMEQLCLTIRWVDDRYNIHEDPLELYQLPQTDTETIFKALKDCLIRFSIPLTRCCGQGYDGAANMSGHLNGVAAKLQKEAPGAVYVHCLAHCINLCLQTVTRQCLAIRNAIDI